jgi:hypothetical protein
MTNELITITKEDFEAYEAVRSSGILNMLGSRVQKIARLTKAQHTYIIGHYEDLMKKYPDVRKG